MPTSLLDIPAHMPGMLMGSGLDLTHPFQPMLTAIHDGSQNSLVEASREDSVIPTIYEKCLIDFQVGKLPTIHPAPLWKDLENAAFPDSQLVSVWHSNSVKTGVPEFLSPLYSIFKLPCVFFFLGGNFAGEVRISKREERR